MITSAANEKIKHASALLQKAPLRREEKLFVIEGGRLFREAPDSLIKEVYVSENFLKNADAALLEKLDRTGFEEVSEPVFRRLSDTKTPQGIFAVVRQIRQERQALYGAVPLLLLLEDIQDPGNLGTILRAAEGAGATGIIMSRGCVDIYNPKVVRSTMGSIFRVPFMITEDLAGETALLQKEKIRVFAAHLSAASDYDREDYTGGCAFVIGNEANGLKKETAKAADALIRIPMLGQVESLNAGVSAALLAYEAARQRRGKYLP